jgi:hypothetical protein
VEIYDYRNCYILYTSACDGVERNTCRIQVLSCCELTNEGTGKSHEFFLGKACIGEHVYPEEGGIAQIPTSEACIIFTDREHKLVKKFASHDRDLVQIAGLREKKTTFSGLEVYLTDVHFSLPMAQARVLESHDDIIKATLDFEPMVGRTTIWDADRHWRAVIEFPMTYINVLPRTNSFQPDVGPVLYPDFASTSMPLISRLELAYVMFQDFDKAEFAVHVPTAIGTDGECKTLHYSKVVYTDAKNELFSLAP